MRKNGTRKRIAKRRDPWYNKYLHTAKRGIAAAAGGTVGYIHRNLPGAYVGARYGWNYVGRYKRPRKAKLRSNAPGTWKTGSNRARDTGSNKPPVTGSNGGPPPKSALKKGVFHPNIWHRPGHKFGHKFVSFK